MLSFVKSIYSLLQFKLIGVLILMVVGGLFEGLSLVLLIPILQTAIDVGIGDSKYVTTLTDFASWLGFEFSLEFGLVLFLCVFCIQVSIFFLRDKNIAYIISSFRKKIRCDLYASLLESQWSYLIDKTRGSLVSAVVNDAEKAGNSVYNLMGLFTAIVVSMVYATTAFLIAPSFTVIMILLAGLMFFALKRLMSKGTGFGLITSEGNNLLQTVLNEHFDAMKLIKGGAFYEMSKQLIDNAAQVLCDVEQKSLVHNAKIKAYAEPVIIILLCVGIFLAVEIMSVAIAELMVVLFIFMRLFPRIIQINQAYFQVLLFKPSFDRVMQLFGDAKTHRERAFEGGTKFKGFGSGVEFRGVSFSYNQEQQIIKEISFSINKGKTIAIVGTSGAGKSTLTDLILGLSEPDDGAVYVDGQSLRDIDLISYRKKIGYISQETILIHGTIKQNILWGLDQPLSDQKLETIARLCHVHDFVNKLPEKYDTVIGDKGLMISGGQRQRLAIARALIREPEFLILDEATSALDSESEKIVQKSIEALSDRVTIIIIAHRLSTIVNADEIVVLENGSIVENGNFEQLMSNDGRFKYMYDLQNH